MVAERFPPIEIWAVGDGRVVLVDTERAMTMGMDVMECGVTGICIECTSDVKAMCRRPAAIKPLPLFWTIVSNAAMVFIYPSFIYLHFQTRSHLSVPHLSIAQASPEHTGHSSSG